MFRILLIADPYIRVPPTHYGGIERVVADLADGLHRRGHDVTLWAAPGSHVPCRLEPFGRHGEWTRMGNVCNIAVLGMRFAKSIGRFDIIHNFGRLAYLLCVLRLNVPKIQTYMRSVNPRNMHYVARLGAHRLHYTAVSSAIRSTGEVGGGDWSVIYNCAPSNQFEARLEINPDRAPLLFLGRLERCKGAHTAIEVARRVGRELLLAGTLSQIPSEREYFEREIRPKIDGQLIRYVGPQDNAQKNRLLGSAAALLLPVEWEEPFPVVLPEALLCGTPIVAFRRGGVPEGIHHGRTGFVCDSVEEMVRCVGRLAEIDRSVCRREAERRFSDAAIVSQYEDLYQRLISALSLTPN